MMHLAFTRRPMSLALQAILDPQRLLPTKEEASRTTADLAARLGVKTWHARRRAAGKPDRRNWVGADFRKRSRAGKNLTDAQQASIIELYLADQWPSLSWLAEQVGTSKGQVDVVLAAAGLRKPAASKLAGQMDQLERSLRFRPDGHITKSELAERLGIRVTAAANRLSKRGMKAVMVSGVGFYPEEELRKAGVLP